MSEIPLQGSPRATWAGRVSEREFFIDNLLVRVHHID